VLLAGITGAVLAAGRRWRYLPVGWFWYLGTLVPVIGLVQVGPQALADRYTYVPLIGLFIMGVWGLADLAASLRFSRGVLVGAAMVVLLAGALLSGRQVLHWRNSISLWSRAHQVTPRNQYAATNLGNIFLEQRNLALKRGQQGQATSLFKKAKAYYEEAVAWDPNFPFALYSLAGILRFEGNQEEAGRKLLQAAEAAGDLDDWALAVRAAEQALETVPAADTALRARIRRDLRLYREKLAKNN
jgi:tetratricopeptide (TPR) repeat protein